MAKSPARKPADDTGPDGPNAAAEPQADAAAPAQMPDQAGAAPAEAIAAAPAEDATQAPDVSGALDPQPTQPGLCAMLRAAIDGYNRSGGDAYLTGEFEAVILILHEARNKIAAVLDKTEGELQARLFAHLDTL